MGAGILLAQRGHIRMSQNAVVRNVVATTDIVDKVDQCRDLDVRIGLGTIRPGATVAPVLQLDPDGAGIDIRDTAPGGDAGMPGATVLRHQRVDAPIGVDEIVCRDLRRGIGQQIQCGRRIGRVRIVQHKHVHCRAVTVIVIGGRAVPDHLRPLMHRLGRTGRHQPNPRSFEIRS